MVNRYPLTMVYTDEAYKYKLFSGIIYYKGNYC